MKLAMTTSNLAREHFVLKINGQVRSRHPRLIEAMRAALKLRNEFPQHDIKVSAVCKPTSGEEQRVMSRCKNKFLGPITVVGRGDIDGYSAGSKTACPALQTLQTFPTRQVFL